MDSGHVRNMSSTLSNKSEEWRISLAFVIRIHLLKNLTNWIRNARRSSVHGSSFRLISSVFWNQKVLCLVHKISPFVPSWTGYMDLTIFLTRFCILILFSCLHPGLARSLYTHTFLHVTCTWPREASRIQGHAWNRRSILSSSNKVGYTHPSWYCREMKPLFYLQFP